jgi:hypothetical protein
VVTLLLGGTAAFVTRGTFAGRYASVLYPLFVLVLVYGVTVFGDRRIRAAILAVVAIFGLGSGLRVLLDDRTEARPVADAIRARAKPGDVVLYCPDQIGPSESRLLGGMRLVQLTFPAGDRPELVDWVDYKERRDRVDANAFTQGVLDRTRAGSTIWYVVAVQYRGGNEGKCDAILHSLNAARPDGRQIVPANDKYGEFFALFEYPPR